MMAFHFFVGKTSVTLYCLQNGVQMPDLKQFINSLKISISVHQYFLKKTALSRCSFYFQAQAFLPFFVITFIPDSTCSQKLWLIIPVTNVYLLSTLVLLISCIILFGTAINLTNIDYPTHVFFLSYFIFYTWAKMYRYFMFHSCYVLVSTKFILVE